MKEEDLLEQLVELARSLDFDVRFDRGSFRDGACRVDDRKIIVLNRRSPVSRKVSAIAKALSEQPLEGIFVLPAVREAIERAKMTETEPSIGRQNG